MTKTEALQEIAEFAGHTLLGCADENCDFYPHCDEREKLAFERGANRAFKQAAAIAQAALDADEKGQRQ